MGSLNGQDATNENDHSITADIQDDQFDHELIEVTTSATFLSVNGSTNMPKRKELYIENKGNKKIWIGTSAVTDDGGIKEGRNLDVGDFMTLPFGPNLDVYGITDSGTSDVLIWESA